MAVQFVQLTQWRDRAGFSPNFQVLREPLHCIVTQRACQRQHWIGTLTSCSHIPTTSSLTLRQNRTRGHVDRYGARMRSEVSSGSTGEVCL
jgi:hypothetical protein